LSSTLLAADPITESFGNDVGDSGAVAVTGNKTRWLLGGEIHDGTREIKAPTGIIEYIPEEMVVRVRAGTPVAELHSALAQYDQWSALPERGGTVGGAIAVAESDFRRPARGELRAAVLQVRYVSAEGRVISGGGPTVKNVTGFDLPRILTGSLGTLGFIAEVILRTNPIPPSVLWLTSVDADPFEIQRTLLAPGSILWDGTTTTVMLTGHERDVDADIDRLKTLGTFDPCVAPDTPLGHRWSLPPGDLRDLDHSSTGAFVAEVAVGVVHAEKPQPALPLSTSVLALHERLKAEFDPTGRLNPGRTVGVR